MFIIFVFFWVAEEMEGSRKGMMGHNSGPFRSIKLILRRT